MKTSAFKKSVIAARLTLFLFAFNSVSAQPRYDFRNASRISGTDRQIGALYRFPNVRSGVDALVSITAITGGLIINTLDGTSSGFAEAFQPVITLPARSRGYAEFNITFVTAGTTAPMVQTEVPVTPIDVDGEAGRIYEFDEIFLYSGSYVDYSMTGNEIQLNYPAANQVNGINTGGITYDGVDTTAKEVMFSVVNASISSLVIRVGANNISNQSLQRLRSIYFQKFNYPSSVLAVLAPWSSRESTRAGAPPYFKVFPTIFNKTVNVNFNVARSGTAVLRLADYSGKIVWQQTLRVQNGNNKFNIDDWGNIAAGSYIALIKYDNTSFRQKIYKQ